MGNILNITNGDYFNKYFINKFSEEAIPFCENMMDGSAVAKIFSEESIVLRSKEMGVSIDEYKSKMRVYNVLEKGNYSELCLWFGKDAFCQINLLTLLAYLEQIDCKRKITLNHIDDESLNILESNILVELNDYNKIYQDVLINKKIPNKFGVLSEKAIRLYFDYHSKDGVLSRLVKNNKSKDKKEIVCLLIENSKGYGLSVEQAKKLVELNG